MDVTLEGAADALRRFAASVPRVGAAAQRELTAVTASEEVLLMPVDTGRAEASVRTSAGDPVVAGLPGAGPYTPPDYPDLLAGTAGLAPGDATYVTDDAKNPRNGFVYAWRVAVEGSSSQAPEGVVEPALAAADSAWPGIVERAINAQGERG